MDENLNVAANIGEVATPQNSVETTTEVTAEPTKAVESTETKEDITQTQAFSQRLKEATNKAKQEAIDEYIASQGYIFDGKPITTKAEYDKALEITQERQRQEDLKQQGIDPKVVEEYVNNNPTVKWAKEYQTKQEQEQAKQKQYLEFSEAYPNVKGEDIPAEVWQEFNKGTPLKIAYAIHENSKLRAELDEFKKGAKTNESNLKNAQSAIGSINGQGNLPTDFITKDVFEANKKDQAWLNKNYDLLKNSMIKW